MPAAKHFAAQEARCSPAFWAFERMDSPPSAAIGCLGAGRAVQNAKLNDLSPPLLTSATMRSALC